MSVCLVRERERNRVSSGVGEIFPGGQLISDKVRSWDGLEGGAVLTLRDLVLLLLAL